jgi:hypothetical protein
LFSVTGEPGEAYYYFGPQLKGGLGISSIKAHTNRLLSEYPKCLLFLIVALCIQFAILYYGHSYLSTLTGNDSDEFQRSSIYGNHRGGFYLSHFFMDKPKNSLTPHLIIGRIIL